ncbi:MAG: 50S ribosomal protein L17 [Thermus sp.]|nr:50S ribosomal protein L17 [Thermus sp.]
MRHLKSGSKLNRHSSHRLALYRNQAKSLLIHGRITTTLPKAKALTSFVDHLIHLAKRGDLHARRLVLRDLQDVKLVRKLFDEIAPRYQNRPGGYTRVLKLAERRRGDGAPLALVELLE